MSANVKNRKGLQVAPKAESAQDATVTLGVRLLSADNERFARIAKDRGLAAGTLGRVVILEWLKAQAA